MDNRLEVADGAVAASLGFGGLDEAVDGLDDAVGNLGVEPAEDAAPVAFDHACRRDHRRQGAMGGPPAPFLRAPPGVAPRTARALAKESTVPVALPSATNRTRRRRRSTHTHPYLCPRSPAV